MKERGSLRMSKSRIMKLRENYIPCEVYENEEIYPIGIFKLNISRIKEHIKTGKLNVRKEEINVTEWFKTHPNGVINEDHINSVNIAKPVVQAEIRPGMFTIIDGNHRMEKAYRNNIKHVQSYKLTGEQLVDYFIEGYETFVEYWNSKL